MISKTENNPPRAQDEPSMEEILTSIRRIISQEGGTEEAAFEGSEDQIFDPPPDDDADSKLSPNAAPETEPLEEKQDIIQELQPEDQRGDIQENIAEETPSLSELEADIPPATEQKKLDRGSNDMQEDDILLLTQMLDDDGTVIDLSEKEGSRARELISMQTARQSSEAFAALANALVRENAHKGRTLEDLIKDIMRPLLKEWLDNHLSDMVERIVQDEIEKIAGRTRH